MNYPFPCLEHISADPSGSPRFLVLSSNRHAVTNDDASRFVFSPANEFDGIVVLDSQGTDTVQSVIRRSNAYLLPLANLSGTPLPFADFQANEPTPETLNEAVEALSHISHLIRMLPEDVRLSRVPETILLARAYSRNRVIEPVYDPSVPDCVTYPVAGLLEDTGRRAERMTNAGYLTRMFFDRLRACPDCGSSRLNAREECVACRSVDLTDESLIHHLRCGHRAMIGEFRQNDLLICPNCWNELRLEGVDYVTSGRVNACGSCGHVDSQVSVGFICTDCMARHDSEEIATRDFYKYALTRKGERALATGQPWVHQERLETGPSPEEAIIHHSLQLYSRYGRPLTILKISFGDEAMIRHVGSTFALTQASSRVADLLRSETRETDVVVDTENGFLVYMPETAMEDLGPYRSRLRECIASSVPADLGIVITAIHPDDLKPAIPKKT